ncbi:MAG: diguanylate cyclase/phosphodiesterase (GGDEF & EAL domains) with PAS/PAC sensor(s), partial [uncultured Solirubrobacteraceae bacterium]
EGPDRPRPGVRPGRVAPSAREARLRDQRGLRRRRPRSRVPAFRARRDAARRTALPGRGNLAGQPHQGPPERVLHRDRGGGPRPGPGRSPASTRQRGLRLPHRAAAPGRDPRARPGGGADEEPAGGAARSGPAARGDDLRGPADAAVQPPLHAHAAGGAGQRGASSRTPDVGGDDRRRPLQVAQRPARPRGGRPRARRRGARDARPAARGGLPRKAGRRGVPGPPARRRRVRRRPGGRLAPRHGRRAAGGHRDPLDADDGQRRLRHLGGRGARRAPQACRRRDVPRQGRRPRRRCARL